MVTVYFITIHNKTGVEISNLNSISYDEHCCNCERKALKDDSLSVFIIILLDDHNTKRVLNSSWKDKRGPFDGMDREEDFDRDREGDWLGDRDVITQRVSEAENWREMRVLVKEYEIVNSDGEYERSPPKLELMAEHYREYIKQASLSPPVCRSLPTPPLTPPLPISAMDISSVCFQPVPVKAQAVITSTHGHPRMIWPVRPKVNINIAMMHLGVLDPIAYWMLQTWRIQFKT